MRQTGSWNFEFAALGNLTLSWDLQMFVFIAVMLACAIKCPLFPFHSWLPLAYGEAPPAGTALMAGALSKMGALGILKLALPLCPDVAKALGPQVMILAVVSILYGAVIAPQTDQLQTADSLLFTQPHGLYRPGHIQFSPGLHPRRPVPDFKSRQWP